MFNELASSQINKKLVYIAYQLGLADAASNEETAILELESFKSTFYQELISTLEAKQCAQSMFYQKFQRLDILYLGAVDLYSQVESKLETHSELSST